LLIVGSVGRITAKAYPEYLSETTNFLESSPSYNLAIPNSSQKNIYASSCNHLKLHCNYLRMHSWSFVAFSFLLKLTKKTVKSLMEIKTKKVIIYEV